MTRHLKPRRRKRSWAQRGVIAAGLCSSLVLLGSAAGLGYLYKKVERIPRVQLSRALDEVEEPGAPENYLVVGIDSAARTDPDDPIRVGRDNTNLTDTIMVVRVDPTSESAAILSLPRDLWVPYPGGGNGKINGLFARGGGQPSQLIEVINTYLGLPIHHYVQIDLAGFYDLVDAIDGVPVYFDAPARDENSGLWVTETGCVTLDREQAIGYVRSRHYEYLVEGDGSSDRDWQPDNKNDFGRIERQQDFIRRALERAVSKGARNLGTLDRLIDVGLRSVTIDDALTPGAIFDLAKKFRSFDPDTLQNDTLPAVGDIGPGGASILRMKESEAEPILVQFRDQLPPDPGSGGGEGGGGEGGAADVQPAAVRITVLNGTGVPGQAAEAGDALVQVGFGVIDRRDAQGEDLGLPLTVVRYPAEGRAQAELVARWLEADAQLVEAEPGSGTGEDVGIEVITGEDWAGIRTEPREAPATTTSTSTASTTNATTGTTVASIPPGSSVTGTDPDATTSTTEPHPC